MSATTGASSQVIVLPKGGGALHGIGEKFAPDLHTGTGNFTIPIALPPGRNGVQPQLNLVYSTGNGNGPIGLGWNLSIPGVSRKTSKGIPRYDDIRDVFILSGSEDLVPVARPAPNVTRYWPRTEGLFARIDHHHDPAGGDFWEVRSKDGLLSRYGTPRPAGATDDWRDPAAIADPDQPRHVFAWKLTSTTDPFGNRIEYVYQRDAAPSDGPHHWDQLYLSEIRYADYDDPATPDAPRFLVAVRFTYAGRPDPFSEYRAGFELRTVRRCATIEVFTHAQPNTLARSYQLIYLDQRDLPAEQLPLNGVSLLSQVRVAGHAGNATEALPPLEFGYTRFEPQRRTFAPVGGADLPPASLAHADYDLVDLFGNGLPDILEMNGTVRYWRNLGGGAFDRPCEMRDAPGGLHLADPGVQMIDANGDGRPDLMLTRDDIAGYFPLRFGGAWDRRSFQRYQQAPSFNLRDPEVRMIDLDGDGVTDAIRSGSRLECFFNDPHAGWYATRALERQALERFPNINFSDPRVKWADMSGDGLQDVALIADGHVAYWPNRGYGAWGRPVQMRNSPRLPYGYDPRRILVGDVDGDGLADLVYVDDTRVTLWINQSGNGWSDPIVIAGTPPVADTDAVRLTDLLGSGVGGVLWSTDAGGRARRSMYFLDFTGGAKPYLLHEMDNHLGALMRVGYAPSTRFYLEDQRRPETRWRTPLPFPVQVVARVEVIDAISGGKLTTKYAYHHGYWDGAEREFRGFGRVDQRDTEVFEDFHTTGLHPNRRFEPVAAQAFSPPTETRTWFHQGPVGDEFGEWAEADFSQEFWPGDPPALARPPATTNWLNGLPRRIKRDALRTMRGSILRSELYTLDGAERQDRPYTVTEHLYGLREEAAPDANDGECPHIFFPHALAQRTTQWERGDDPMTQVTFTSDYDAFGQPCAQISIAVPRGRDFRADAAPGEPYLTTYAMTTYAQRDSAQQYMVNRVASVTTYEILNDGSPSVFALHDAILAGAAARRVIGHTRSFYDGPAFEGLPFGWIGDYGALARAESLVLTEELLSAAYASGNTAVVPAYLTPGGTPPWTDEYPVEFRTRLAMLAGYTFHPGGSDPSEVRGFYAQTERLRYDVHDSPVGRGRGLVTARRDPLGHDTAVSYDRFDMLPTTVTDPAGLTTTADYDYRVLQPREVADPDGNRIAYVFSPLGLLQSTAVMGKSGENAGDTAAAPGTRLVYDFFAFADRREPVLVRTIRRMHHVNETDIPLPDRDATIESVEYSDGFGRLLQTRAQAEDVIFGDPVFGGAILPIDQSLPAGDAIGRQRRTSDPPNVVVSGWQIYDNKGRVVEKYEPFFSVGWDYAPPAEGELGQKATMFYDPRGHVVRTVNPDGSEQRVIHGVPDDLADPTRYRPTPWEAYTYDANDNAGLTHPAESGGFQSHWNTPASIMVDALGRTIASTARNGADPAADWYVTRSTYDIQGNLLTVTDALGRVAFTHVYDLAKHPLLIKSIDAGERRSVLDAAGNIVEQRDSKGALTLHAYDVLNRPVRLWARDGAGQALTLRERLVYGDAPDAGLSAAQARAANLLGKLYRHYDEAGRLKFERYDFKGNPLEKVRQAIGDQALLAVFNSPPPDWNINTFRVDWQAANADVLLDPTEYRTTMAYDALNRIKTLRYPQDVSGARKELRPHYNRAGALERVELDGATYVEHIAYNAKGQRALIAYGNSIMTRYAYDARTFRLARLRTERFSAPNPLTYRPAGVPLQDFGYAYDLAGNILAIRDRTPGSGVPNTLAGLDALDRAFSYDPLYRLLSATGREHAMPPADVPWLDAVRSQDPTLARSYAERYQYDPVGNIARIQHQANGGSFTRDFALAPGSNRLASVTIGATPYAYAYDSNGNLMRESSARHFEWDHADRLRAYRTQPAGVEPSVHAQYLYDAGDQRVEKLVRRQGGGYEVTIYIDGLFEHHRLVQGSTAQDNDTLHVMDNQARIALLRVGAPFPGDAGPALQYHLGDHLGSSNVVVAADTAWINREEHTPYGETSFGGFSRKRYRFTGKERDEESELCYHGARYYAPWVARWANCDPKGMVDGVNLYEFVRSDPINRTDPHGTQSSGISGMWNDVKQGTAIMNNWINTKADAAAASIIYNADALLDRAGIKSGPLREVIREEVVQVAAGTSTALKVGGGIVTIGPNLIVGLSEVPSDVKQGVSDIRTGIHEGGAAGALGVAVGGARILKAAGTVADVALLAESGFQAARTRSAIRSATAPLPQDAMNGSFWKQFPSTRGTSGTVIMRDVKFPEGTGFHSTTVVSREGVTVSQHADSLGKSGVWATDRPIGAAAAGRTPSRPALPSEWTGVAEIPRRTIPPYARTGTLTTHAVVVPQATQQAKESPK